MRRRSTEVRLDAYVDEAFAFLDDFHKLSAHMEKPSGMMAGSKMTIESDAQGGRAVGSHVRMRGRMMGVTLELDEVVTERQPPLRKAWRTVDANLLVIGAYRLGFELAPEESGSRLSVFIEYELPSGAARWLGLLFSGFYADWCIRRMASDAVTHFAPKAVSYNPSDA
jgi:hypothetical protein